MHILYIYDEQGARLVSWRFFSMRFSINILFPTTLIHTHNTHREIHTDTDNSSIHVFIEPQF